jgi:hemerythrin-like domain-containing protein
MCGHCGCHGVDAIRELVDEHVSLVEDGAALRTALARGDHATAHGLLARLVAHLDSHVRREEEGIFRALRDQGDFADEVDALEGEHRDLDAAVAALDPGSRSFEAAAGALLAELEQHIEREDLGIFPVAVVTLGLAGWDTIDAAHARTASFLATGRTPPERT